MISPKDHFRYNNKTFKSTESSCGSYNIIYLVYCSICNKLYIGRSTRPLRIRIGEHRRNFYHILDNKPYSTDNDDFILGSHLYDHGFRDKSDFNKIYRTCVLEICSPSVLDIKEHKYVHLTNSMIPNGLNLSNPLSIPLLYS